MGPAGGHWGGQRGTRVLRGWGQETEPSGGALGLGTQPPGPSGSESSTNCLGRRGTQAPVWCGRSEPGWVGVRGAPWRKRPWERRSILGTGVGMMVAEAGAGEVEEAATPKMLQAPDHCHLTLGDLFSCPPPRLPGHEHPALQPPSPAGPRFPNPEDTQACPPARPTASLCHGRTLAFQDSPAHTGAQRLNARVQTPAWPRSARDANKLLLILRLKLQLTLPSIRPRRKQHMGADRQQ